MTNLNIVNLVASARYTDSLDIIAVAEDLGIDYEPEQFPGMVYRNTNPKVCVLLFRSGKAVATGAKSYEQAEIALRTLYDKLVALNYNLWNYTDDIILQNLVITHDVGATLNLPYLSVALPMERTEYEPEQFPGLIYRLDDPSAVCLVFSSGKCVITGCKSTDDALKASKNLTKDVKQHTQTQS